MRVRPISLCTGIFFLFLSTFFVAQTTTAGSICGQVIDPSRAAISSAQITLTALATNNRIVIGSGSGGDFCFLQLAPSTYDLTVEALGFAAAHMTVQVEVGRITPVTAELLVAAAKSEVVDVTVTTPAVNTLQPDFATSVDQAAIENLPINGRRWSNFALLTPGSSTDGDF
jgi:hypothetical protein